METLKYLQFQNYLQPNFISLELKVLLTDNHKIFFSEITTYMLTTPDLVLYGSLLAPSCLGDGGVSSDLATGKGEEMVEFSLRLY